MQCDLGVEFGQILFGTGWYWMVLQTSGLFCLCLRVKGGKNMSKSNTFLCFQSNKLLVWCKALLNMHGLCLCAPDSVKIKDSTRSLNSLLTGLCQAAGEWILSSLPSLLCPAPPAWPRWYPSRNSCHNYVTANQTHPRNSGCELMVRVSKGILTVVFSLQRGFQD